MRSLLKLLLTFLLLSGQPVLAEDKFNLPKGKWNDKKYDVISLDNAIYDTFEIINISALKKIIKPLGAKKGEMMIVSKKQFHQINSPNKIFAEYAGGSAANTLAFLASMGKKTVFIGTVSNDKAGNKFIESLRKVGVEFAGFKKSSEEPTGQSHVFITEDGKRTMLTLLGSSSDFSSNEVDTSILEKTKIFFTQAYIVGNEERNNLLKTMLIKTKSNGGINMFALSSAYVVKKKLNDIEELIPLIDIIIGNILEFESLYSTKNLDEILQKTSLNKKLNIVTLGDKGAYIVYQEKRIFVPIKDVKVIDTTGTGDAFAGGIIYGVLNGFSIEESGDLAATAASKIAQKIGARLDGTNATELAKVKQ